MKNYDPNIRWGTHTIEVTFQQWEYSGTVQYQVGGNSKGASLFDGLADTLEMTIKFVKNDCQLNVGEDGWFKMVLVNPDGDEMIVEEEIDFLEEKIVGVRIVELIEEGEEK